MEKLSVPFEERIEYFLNGNMKGMSLGKCLDSTRWGGQTSVMWRMNFDGMIAFISCWMRQNEHHYDWGEREDVELPYMKRNCPHGHKVEEKNYKYSTEGFARCPHKEEIKVREGFYTEFGSYDSEAKMHKICFIQHTPETDRECVSYEKAQELSVDDYCYAILSDEETSLGLRQVLERVCFINRYNNVVAQFDGHDLAAYVKAWYEQGDATL